jgi:hypothetical protein
MRRALLLALVCCGCAAVRQEKTMVTRCAYVEDTSDPRALVNELDSFGPATVVWMHRDPSYLVVRDGQLFRCTSP